MKSVKRLLITILILILVFLAGYFWLSKGSNYQLVYLVPDDALLIAQSKNLSQSLKTIQESDIWEYLKTNENFAEVQQSMAGIDSLLSKKKLFIRLIASRKTQISVHPVGTKKDIMAVVDLKRLGSLKNLDKKLSKVMGNQYSISSRIYNKEQIVEMLSLENSEMYYLSILKNKLVFSNTHSIIEKAIDQQNNLTLGRDLHFIEVNKHLKGKGLLNLIIPVKNWETQKNNPFETENQALSETYRNISYIGAILNIDNGNQIDLQAFANISDTANTFGNVLIKSGTGKNELAEVSSKRAASMVSITFDSFDSFYQNLLASFPQTQREQINDMIDKTNQKLKIDVQENLFGWIDDEIGFLQTQPSNLGKRNEFALVLKAKKGKLAKKNLDFINEQIRKHTPIKFKSVEYEGHVIQYLSIGPMLKTLFGNLINKLEKPYYTILDEFVVFSNHPQTLKNIIDDYNQKVTLAYDADYYNFMKSFKNNLPMFTYVNTDILYNNLQHMVSPELWQTIKKNKDYIVCFNNAGIEINSLNNLLIANFLIQFSPETEIVRPVVYQQTDYVPAIEFITEQVQDKKSIPIKVPEDTLETFQAKIIINDLDSKRQEEFYNNNNLKFEVELKHGFKHGSYKEYYENGELKIKGKYNDDHRSGTWKYYNLNGKLVLEKEY